MECRWSAKLQIIDARDRFKSMKHLETIHKLYKAIILPVFEVIIIAPIKPDCWTAQQKSDRECLKSFAEIPSKASYERAFDAMFTESKALFLFVVCSFSKEWFCCTFHTSKPVQMTLCNICTYVLMFCGL